MDRRAFVDRCGMLLGTMLIATEAGGWSPQRDTHTGPASAAPPRTGTSDTTRRLSTIGLELYSVRVAMQRDPERTLAAVRKIGYTDVELLWSFGNFGRTPAQVRQSLANEGLRATSAHVSPSTILVGWERSLDIARLLGHQTMIVPSFSADLGLTLDDWKEWAERFNRAGEVARRAGIWLAFHNEPEHQRTLDGQVPLDVFVAATDPQFVRLQLDVGNMVMGGADPLDFLTKHGQRCWSFHIKDVVADRSRDTELGKGTVDLRRILAAVPDLEQRTVFVEQEGASDPLASAKVDFDYLKAMEL